MKHSVRISRTIVAAPALRATGIISKQILHGPSDCQKRAFRLTALQFQEKLSFQGQLYQSTAQRLARERADEDRFIKAQEATERRGTLMTFAYSVGLRVLTIGRIYMLTTNSFIYSRRRLLLSWIEETQGTTLYLHNDTVNRAAS